MKTYACGKCGDRVKLDDAMDIPCCGSVMHELDGIISGGGVKQIWINGRCVWEGNHMKAVEWIQDALIRVEELATAQHEMETMTTADRDIKRAKLAIETIDGYGKFTPGMDGHAGLLVLRRFVEHVEWSQEQQAEADRIVRSLASLYLPTSSGRELVGLLKAAVMHVAKYPKT